MLTALRVQRLLTHHRHGQTAFSSAVVAKLLAPRSCSSPKLPEPVYISYRSIGRSAKQKPEPAEGIEDVCDRLSRLGHGPFPPVSSSTTIQT